jgi:nucleotide-binding universal stress UspA family protein
LVTGTDRLAHLFRGIPTAQIVIMGTLASRRTVVVGIDRSEPSRAALDWAVEYARHTGSRLLVVSVHPHWHAGLPFAVVVAGAPLIEQRAWDEEDRLAISELYRSVAPEPDWKLRQVSGEPGPELIRATERAALLVVGTGEHRGFDRFLEGSVSRYCLTHSPVPVVAVPAPRTAERVSVAPDAAAALGASSGTRPSAATR